MGAAAAISLTLAAIGTAGSMATRNSTAKAQAKQFEIQREQAKIASADRSLQLAENLNQLVSSNTAAAAGRGVSLASPSFKAINNAAFGKFQEDEKMESLNLMGRLAYFDTEQQMSSYQKAFGMFADLSRFGEKFFNTVNLNK